MSKTILVLHGPNLNMLGMREPSIYGTATYQDVVSICAQAIKAAGYEIDARQSNYEGELVTWIQEAFLSTRAGSPQTGGFGKQNRPTSNNEVVGVIINAGAYTHTSVAIHDALRLLACPVAEVHISDPRTREAFRHTSYIEPVASVHVVGKGVDGYKLAIEQLVQKISI